MVNLSEHGLGFSNPHAIRFRLVRYLAMKFDPAPRSIDPCCTGCDAIRQEVRLRRRVRFVPFLTAGLVVLAGDVAAVRAQSDRGAKQAPSGETAQSHPQGRGPRFATSSQSGQLATQLAVSSLDAFRRGLMPTYDYLERLSYIHAMQLQEAEESKDPQRIRAAAQTQIAELRVALAIAESLRQPNAEGWIADTFLLKASLAEAEQRLATAQGNRGAAALAAQEQRAATEGYLKQIIADYDLGIGSLPGVANAVFLTASLLDQGKPGAAGRQAAEFQKAVLLTTAEWSRRGAEIGRTDRVQESVIDQNRSKFKLSIVSGDSAEAVNLVRAADQSALNMFQTRLEYLGRGTESLSGLTHAWLLRQQVQQIAGDMDGQLTPEMERSLHSDLSLLRKSADDVRDLRGRNLADVQFVRLIAETTPPLKETP